MALSTYTVRLGLGQLEGPADVLLYTAAADEVIVVRDIVLANLAAAAQVLSCHLKPVSGEWIRLLLVPAAQVNESYHWDGRQRMHAGDELRVVGASGPATYAVTGYRFVEV